MEKYKPQQQSIIVRGSLNISNIHQKPVNRIEKGIDNYTRMLEQDKRKFFRVQEHRNQTIKTHIKKQSQLNLLKSKQFKTQTIRKKGQINILERQLQQTINSFNQIVASNKKIKFEIDEMRKQKLNHNDTIPKLIFKIQELKKSVQIKKQEIQQRKNNIQTYKNQILKLKTQNEGENKCFRSQLNVARSGLHISNAKSMMKHNVPQQKTQLINTLPLLKYRLKYLLSGNKQKIKVIEYYEKTMKSIYDAFNYIKQQSGLQDMQEITGMFLKNEQQQHKMYTIISNHNKQIQNNQQQIQILKKKIDQKNTSNKLLKQQLGITPQKQYKNNLKLKLQQQYKIKIDKFQQFLHFIQNKLKNINITDQLNSVNIFAYLSQVQLLIQKHYPQNEKNNKYHQQITKYTKPPTGCQQLQNSREQKILDKQKLREFAVDFLQKKKASTTQR